MATINLQAILTAAATRATARAASAAAKAERKPRAPGLHTRFLRDLLAQVGQGAAELPLTATVNAWVEAARAAGEDLGAGKTPEASITARLYTAEAGDLPSRVQVRKGRPATLVIAPDTVATTEAGAAAQEAERARIAAEAAQATPAPAEAQETAPAAPGEGEAHEAPARHGRSRRHA